VDNLISLDPSSFQYIVPRMQTVHTGDDAIFKCYSDNIATWYVLTEYESPDNVFSALSSYYLSPYLNVTSLYIKNVSIQNEGLYSCDFTIREKKYYRDALLKVNGMLCIAVVVRCSLS